MIKKIHVPEFLMGGIRKNHASYEKTINLLAGDTETKPIKLSGLYRKYRKMNNENVVSIKNIKDTKNRLKIFLSELDSISSSKKMNILFFHNLRFDIQVLFLGVKEKFRNKEFIVYLDRKTYKEITAEEYMKRSILLDNNIVKIKCYCSKIWFAKIFYGSQKNKSRYKKSVKILDTFAFFRNSLEDLSDKLNLEHKKYKVDFETVSNEDLEIYLKNDLKTQYDLSKRIIEFHEKYDVKISVSIAQLSARIFKHRFMEKKDVLTGLPSPFLQPAILSYHGGKNGYYFNQVKKIKNVKIYDVSSMYPFAMTQIPNFLFCSYKTVKKIDRDHEGIYCISGYVKKCKYPILYSHDFKPLGGEIKDVWVTSYELKEAIRNKEIKLKGLYGIVVIESNIGRNPLKDFVNHFYEKKNVTPEDHPDYLFYKIILNSLYGKFIQNIDYKVEYDYEYDPENRELKKTVHVGRAGGLFQPLIASLITGYSRAYMHRIEHEGESMHTATDSIMTVKEMSVGKNLGDLTLKKDGDVILFRNKCYVMFSDKMVYATHGFHSNVGELLKLYIMKGTEYKYKRFCNIRESLIRKDDNKKLIPTEWNEFKSNLKVKWR